MFGRKGEKIKEQREGAVQHDVLTVPVINYICFHPWVHDDAQ